jgi:hypothetical protein
MYNGDVNWNHQLLMNPGDQEIRFKVTRFDQSLALTYSLPKNLIGTIQGRSIYNTRSGENPVGYTFLDANIKYKLRKPNADLAFEVSNLTNISTYQLFTVTANQYSESNFAIRGRMAILRITFTL